MKARTSAFLLLVSLASQVTFFPGNLFSIINVNIHSLFFWIAKNIEIRYTHLNDIPITDLLRGI